MHVNHPLLPVCNGVFVGPSEEKTVLKGRNRHLIRVVEYTELARQGNFRMIVVHAKDTCNGRGYADKTKIDVLFQWGVWAIVSFSNEKDPLKDIAF